MDLYDIAVARKLSSGGGGGSSDFSTAEVTIINSTENSVGFGPFVAISNDYFFNESCNLNPNSTEQYQFVMYKGSTPFYYDAYLYGASEAVGTGDIFIEEESDPETGDVHWLVQITGDCTITIS